MIKVCEEASIQVLLYNELQKYFKWKEWQNAKYVTRYVRNIIYTEIHKSFREVEYTNNDIWSM